MLKNYYEIAKIRFRLKIGSEGHQNYKKDHDLLQKNAHGYQTDDQKCQIYTPNRQGKLRMESKEALIYFLISFDDFFMMFFDESINHDRSIRLIVIKKNIKKLNSLTPIEKALMRLR